MRIVALMTVYNEELYLTRTLNHLYNEGIEVCIIDNGSTDKTRLIAESFLNKNVIRIETLPFKGSFALKPILENEQRLSDQISADWLMHHDADEIREAPRSMGLLKDSIAEVDREGYTAINFDEFVFLPTSEEEDYRGSDFVSEMRYYYFFEPYQPRRVNAWKASCGPVDLATKGGHEVLFHNRRIYPRNFILKHYIALSYEHLIAKYGGRKYATNEVDELGWHGARASFSGRRPTLTDRSILKEAGNCDFDRSEPFKQHPFLLETI